MSDLSLTTRYSSVRVCSCVLSDALEPFSVEVQSVMMLSGMVWETCTPFKVMAACTPGFTWMPVAPGASLLWPAASEKPRGVEVSTSTTSDVP